MGRLERALSVVPTPPPHRPVRRAAQSAPLGAAAAAGRRMFDSLPLVPFPRPPPPPPHPHHTDSPGRRNRRALHGSATVVAFDWAAPGAGGPSAAAALRGADFIVGADVVWLPHLVDPLVDALLWLTEDVGPTGARPPVFLAHKTRARATDTELWGAVSRAGFAVAKVPAAQHAPGFSDDDIDIYRLERG